MGDILYLKIDQFVQVNERKVTLSDIASMWCTNNSLENKIKTLKVLTIPDVKEKRYTFSVLRIIELINKEFPQVQVNNVGESDFIIDYKNKSNNKILEIIKVILVCIIVFIGAAFSIMAYNNDVGVNEMFTQIYPYFTGSESDGYTVLEFGYCVGLFVGIVVFYNHFSGRKLSNDPTPLEVELRTYEEDINKSIIDNAGIKGDEIDAP